MESKNVYRSPNLRGIVENMERGDLPDDVFNSLKESLYFQNKSKNHYNPKSEYNLDFISEKSDLLQISLINSQGGLESSVSSCEFFNIYAIDENNYDINYNTLSLGTAKDTFFNEAYSKYDLGSEALNEAREGFGLSNSDESFNPDSFNPIFIELGIRDPDEAGAVLSYFANVFYDKFSGS